MRQVLLLILLVSFGFLKAEYVKKGTIAYTTIGGDAVLNLDSGAMVYPYEPANGKWRMIMWVGFVDTNYVINGIIQKGSPLLELMDFKTKSTTLSSFPLAALDDIFSNNYPDKKKFALYLYIQDTCILSDSRIELRLEKLLTAKKEKQWPMFEQYKTDLGFVSAELIPPYTLHFVHDGRSPEGYNDFRLLVFTDTAKQLVAVAKNSYRPMKMKEKSQAPLDRKLTIHYLIPLTPAKRKEIEEAFLLAYRFRDGG